MRKSLVELLLALIVLLGIGMSLVVTVGTASAQQATSVGGNRFSVCAAYDGVRGFGGNVILAVKDLRSLTEPNPSGVAAALDLIQQDAETLPTPGVAPVPLDLIAAFDALNGYYGPVCAGVGGGGLGAALALMCSAYQTAVSAGGDTAVVAIKDLRSYIEPGPASLENALDVLQDAESAIPPSGYRPTSDQILDATNFLVGYFDPRCQSIDICVWVRAATATDPSAAESARILRGLTAPAPPGIDAALALISGVISESPFHSSVSEARAQVASYFPCPITPVPTPGSAPLELCANLAVIGIPEGPRAVVAAEAIRAFDPPNADVVEDALDVIVAAAQGTGSFADAESAVGVLRDYFNGCDNIDRCALVNRSLSSNLADAAIAAELLWRLETPSPPGIDAALALIGGVVSESPFHNSVAEAQQQIGDYYNCTTLVITGPSTAAPLAALGGSLIAAGAVVAVAGRRRLTSAQ